jgi:hypothetical protein
VEVPGVRSQPPRVVSEDDSLSKLDAQKLRSLRPHFKQVRRWAVCTEEGGGLPAAGGSGVTHCMSSGMLGRGWEKVDAGPPPVAQLAGPLLPLPLVWSSMRLTRSYGSEVVARQGESCCAPTWRLLAGHVGGVG